MAAVLRIEFTGLCIRLEEFRVASMTKVCKQIFKQAEDSSKEDR
jgi:hypothetical protein